MRGSRIVAALGALLLVTLLQAQKPEEPKPEPKLTEQQFKDIQMLKGIPEQELLPAMQFMRASLGVECNYCHASEGGRLAPSQNTEKKETARKMMLMTRAINDTNFAGKMEVTCATCHRGSEHPATMPPVADEARARALAAVRAAERPSAGAQAGAPGAQPGATTTAQTGAAPSTAAQTAAQAPAKPALPSAEELFARYVEAIGGRAAIEKLTSRVAKGSLTTATGDKFQLEAQQKPPNKVFTRMTFANNSSRLEVFDGNAAWVKQGDRVQDSGGGATPTIKLSANFWRELDPKAVYGQAATRSVESVNGRDAYVVRAAVPGGPLSESLYFDKESGLLLRRLTVLRTVLGPLAEQADLSDYHAVDGVKVPFTQVRSLFDSMFTRKWDEVKFNQPVDDAQFVKPAEPAKSQPAR